MTQVTQEHVPVLIVGAGGDGVALHFKVAQQVFECQQVALAKPLLLRQDPFIIAARE